MPSSVFNSFASFDDVLRFFREWRSIRGSDTDDYDFGGIVHVMLACLDNISTFAIAGEIDDIGAYLTRAQVDFLKTLVKAAEQSVTDD